MYSEKNLTIEIIIPTLNEGNSIGKLIQSINKIKIPQKISILVIDGGSNDQTIKICQDLNVNVIQQKGRGKGNAMKEAAEISKSEIIVFIDGDDTYSASDLPKLLLPIIEDKADMVVGVRSKKIREKNSITTFNSLGNTLFNKFINFSMKSNVQDSLSGYRAIRRDMFNDLILLSSHFEIEVEMTVESLNKGYRISEVPISYFNRKNTETKLNPIGDGIKIGRTLIFIIMNIRPLLFFSLFSLSFFLLAIGFTSVIFYNRYVLGGVIYTPFAILSAMLFILGSLCLVLGLISELIVRSRKRLEFQISRKT
jgi:dolichol-phosphate mannosyltransferase